jgi:fatty acid synthase
MLNDNRIILPLFITPIVLRPGGLGGFGLELCKWMINRGARHLVLVSRSGIKTGYQSLCVRRWNEAGINVRISTADASTPQGAVALIKEARRFGPVGGIFNLAAVSYKSLLLSSGFYLCCAKPFFKMKISYF